MTYQYQQQNSTQTLQEGLEEYYSNIPGLITTNHSSVEMKQFFRSHDVTHVVFGCSTSIVDETLTDFWTLFGSTVKFFDYLSYLNYPETQQIFQEIGYGKTVWIFLRSFPRIFQVLWRTFKMKQKWNWHHYESYLNCSLQEIRQEFGIVVI
ncbi:MAG: hypothetical protein SWJ54_24535 [Cyanobacteriota bacterium]|nr:hypothetical protein [Cyanobacteriota bacterium]